MKSIIKRGLKDSFGSLIFWFGLVYVVIGVYQNTSPYLHIHYLESEQDLQELSAENLNLGDADIMDGYIPASPEKARELWEHNIYQNLVDTFEMSKEDAKAEIKKIKTLDIMEAAQYLEEHFNYYNAQYDYNDIRVIGYQGNVLEVNQYIKEKLKEHDYSYYFARKFADFSGLYMGFFAIIFFPFLFWQDTRKYTYELLHTKPITALQYVMGKVISGILPILFMLFVLNVIFLVLCMAAAGHAGFSVNFLDLLNATMIYIMPNMVMILCVYTGLALLFKNPVPAMPLLFLYMVYSNTGSRNEEGIFGYYGRPLAIMVRFPGKFFDTQIPPMTLLNQVFLVLISIVLILFAASIWKRRRVSC